MPAELIVGNGSHLVLSLAFAVNPLAQVVQVPVWSAHELQPSWQTEQTVRKKLIFFENALRTFAVACRRQEEAGRALSTGGAIITSSPSWITCALTVRATLAVQAVTRRRRVRNCRYQALPRPRNSLVACRTIGRARLATGTKETLHAGLAGRPRKTCRADTRPVGGADALAGARGRARVGLHVEERERLGGYLADVGDRLPKDDARLACACGYCHPDIC